MQSNSTNAQTTLFRLETAEDCVHEWDNAEGNHLDTRALRPGVSSFFRAAAARYGGARKGVRAAGLHEESTQQSAVSQNHPLFH